MQGLEDVVTVSSPYFGNASLLSVRHTTSKSPPSYPDLQGVGAPGGLGCSQGYARGMWHHQDVCFSDPRAEVFRPCHLIFMVEKVIKRRKEKSIHKENLTYKETPLMITAGFLEIHLCSIG